MLGCCWLAKGRLSAVFTSYLEFVVFQFRMTCFVMSNTGVTPVREIKAFFKVRRSDVSSLCRATPEGALAQFAIMLIRHHSMALRPQGWIVWIVSIQACSKLSLFFMSLPGLSMIRTVTSQIWWLEELKCWATGRLFPCSTPPGDKTHSRLARWSRTANQSRQQAAQDPVALYC